MIALAFRGLTVLALIAIAGWRLWYGTRRPDRLGDSLEDYYDRLERGEK